MSGSSACNFQMKETRNGPLKSFMSSGGKKRKITHQKANFHSWSSHTNCIQDYILRFLLHHYGAFYLRARQRPWSVSVTPQLKIKEALTEVMSGLVPWEQATQSVGHVWVSHSHSLTHTPGSSQPPQPSMAACLQACLQSADQIEWRHT